MLHGLSILCVLDRFLLSQSLLSSVLLPQGARFYAVRTPRTLMFPGQCWCKEFVIQAPAQTELSSQDEQRGVSVEAFVRGDPTPCVNSAPTVPRSTLSSPPVQGLVRPILQVHSSS